MSESEQEITVSENEVIQSDFVRTYPLPESKKDGPPRHIFIFLDGTWNEERTPIGLATPTNVLRMYQEMNLEPPKSSANHEIIAHYFRGVGNRQDNSAPDRLWFGFNGKDEERIRGAAFAALFANYRGPQDLIYIFGFSRGAASARLLARDIVRGLPTQLRIHTRHFSNLLTAQIEPRVERIECLGDSSTGAYQRPKIAFLGCWDTVDAFALPSRFPKEGRLNKVMDKTLRGIKFVLVPRLWKERFRGDENYIPDGVEKAVHCVAIDETRHAFLPTLMPHSETVEEVWFPGVHSDVGGGYDENRLSEAPYNFMKRRLVDALKKNGLSEWAVFKDRSEKATITSSYYFHFHGLLNSGIRRARGILGFGASIRRIRVLGSATVLPKIHVSIRSVRNSNSVFAHNPRDKRGWNITYNPYNIVELKEFDIVDDDHDGTLTVSSRSYLGM
jgi:hypothetical protein